jgi:hypothetical protein
MFRRRRFQKRRAFEGGRVGRPGRAMVPGRNLNPKLQRELRRANRMLSTGDHFNAGEIFASLAHQARDLGIVYPAPMLFMQAAYAYLLSGRARPSEEHARLGLELLAGQSRWRALSIEGQRYVDTLEGEGENARAKGLRTWLDRELNGQVLEAEPEDPTQLPEKCPYCGASMSMEQVGSRGGQVAECHYCGSVVLPRKEE